MKFVLPLIWVSGSSPSRTVQNQDSGLGTGPWTGLWT